MDDTNSSSLYFLLYTCIVGPTFVNRIIVKFDIKVLWTKTCVCFPPLNSVGLGVC